MRIKTDPGRPGAGGRDHRLVWHSAAGLSISSQPRAASDLGRAGRAGSEWDDDGQGPLITSDSRTSLVQTTALPGADTGATEEHLTDL